MFKLLLLTAAAILGVLLILGGGDGPKVRAPGPVRAAPAAAPQVAPNPAAANAPVITDVAQTPERRQNFPGPALRPSPEHADAAAESRDRAADPATATADRLFVIGDRVNFRAGPTTTDAVVGSLTRGAPVTVTGPRSGDWVEIRDDRGRTGFMSASFLSAERP